MLLLSVTKSFESLLIPFSTCLLRKIRRTGYQLKSTAKAVQPIVSPWAKVKLRPSGQESSGISKRLGGSGANSAVCATPAEILRMIESPIFSLNFSRLDIPQGGDNQSSFNNTESPFALEKSNSDGRCVPSARPAK